MTAPTEDEVRALLDEYAECIAEMARLGTQGMADMELGQRANAAESRILARLDEAREDRERLDGLAYDMEGSPVFDQIGAHDIHEIASADPGVEANERDAYCRAFRAAIDQARGEG